MEKKKGLAPGTMETIGGSIKQTVGRLVGSDSLEERGRAEVKEGHRRALAEADVDADGGEGPPTAIDNAIEGAEGTVQQVAGAAKGTAGDILEKPRVKAEGEVQEQAGRRRRKAAKKAERSRRQGDDERSPPA